MRHVIGLPAHCRLEFLTSAPFVLWQDCDGISILRGPKHAETRSCNVEPDVENRIFVVETEGEVKHDIFSVQPLVDFPDPTPVEVPLGMKAAPSMQELIKAAVRQEVSRVAEAAGLGSFVDEDDFDLDGEEDAPQSEYQDMLEEEVVREDWIAYQRATAAAKKATEKLVEATTAQQGTPPASPPVAPPTGAPNPPA